MPESISFNLVFLATGPDPEKPVAQRCEECGASTFYTLIAGVFSGGEPMGPPAPMCQPCAKKKAHLMMMIAENLPEIVRGEYGNNDDEGEVVN